MTNRDVSAWICPGKGYSFTMAKRDVIIILQTSATLNLIKKLRRIRLIIQTFVFLRALERRGSQKEGVRFPS